MAADKKLVEADMLDPSDFEEGALTHRELSPRVRAGAGKLIAHNVSIKARGSRKRAYETLQDQLIQFGLSISMAEDIAEELVDLAVDHAEESNSKYNSNYIGLTLEAATQSPQTQFETGALETLVIDANNPKAQVAGATSVAIGLTTSGTTTTALRDGVGEILALMAGTPKLFVHFEAPNKSEIDGLGNDLVGQAMSGLAGGGDLSPEELADVIAELQDMAAAGEISAEIADILGNLVELAQLQEIAASPNAPEGIDAQIAELAKDIEQQVEQAENLPEELVSMATDAVAEVKSAAVTAEIDGLIAQLTELAGIEGLDAATVQDIEAQIEALEEARGLEGDELADVLNEVKSELADMAASEALPDAAFEAISEIMPALAELSKSVEAPTVPLLDQLPELAAMGAEDLIELINQLSQMENPPEAIKEILDQLNVEALTADNVARALEVGDATELGALMQDLVVAIQTPDVQAELPQAVLNQVNEFVSDNSALVEAVATQSVVQNLETALESVEPGSPEAAQIEKTIEELKSGEATLSDLDVATLASLSEGLDATAMQAVQNSVENITQTVESVTSDNVVLANETIDALETALQDPDISDAVREKVEQALSNGDDAAVLAVLAETPEVVQVLPPALQESVAVAVETHQESLSSSAPVEVALAANTVEAIEAAVESADVSDAVKVELQEALDAGDAVAVAEILDANPELAAVVPETAMVEVAKTAVVVADTPAPVEMSADAVEAIETAIADVDNIPDTVSEEVVSELKEALDAGDAVTVAEIIADNPTIAEVVPDTAIENVTQAAESVAVDQSTVSVSDTAPVLDTDTMANLEAVTMMSSTDPEVAKAVEVYLQDPTSVTALQAVHDVMGDQAPPQVVRALADPIPVATMVTDLKAITQNVTPETDGEPLPIKQKVAVEALNSTIRTMEGIPEGEMISPAQAEVLLRKIDEGRTLVTDPAANAQIDEFREQIMDRTEGGRDEIPEEVRQGKCPGCGGGDCAACGADYKQATKALAEMGIHMDATSTVAQNDNHVTSTEHAVLPPVKELSSDIRSIVDEIKPESETPTLVEKKQMESLSSVATELERNGEGALSPEQAQVLLYKIDTAHGSLEHNVDLQHKIEVMRQDVVSRVEGGPEALPKEVAAGPCGGCQGPCGKCGPDYKEANRALSQMGIQLDSSVDASSANNNNAPSRKLVAS